MPRALILFMNGEFRFDILNELKEYQTIVGGNIESLYSSDGTDTVCYVNEEGRLKNLAINPWHVFLKKINISNFMPNNPIVGNVILFGPTNDEGEDTDVEKRVVNVFREFLNEKSQ